MLWWAAFQSWDLILIIKTTYWSQAEQGEAETLYLLGTNLHQPAFTQSKGQVGSCFQNSEVQIPQTPGVHGQTGSTPAERGVGWTPARSTKTQGRKAHFQVPSVNPLVLLQFHQQVWVCLWMMGLMLQGRQEWGRTRG